MKIAYIYDLQWFSKEDGQVAVCVIASSLAEAKLKVLKEFKISRSKINLRCKIDRVSYNKTFNFRSLD